ncbi:ankyrin repeat domain-containing protein [Nonomuraea sp. NPDC049421]|uniref:ankyrin repeat domain-containing protein n=1 Tax=Nonomuraea sp. NPDC049421 TaxID=3155275 RepID=UPI00342F3DE8
MFPLPAGQAGLSPAESAAVVEARRLISVLGECRQEGAAFAFVADVTAVEAARRLRARPVDEDAVAAILEDPWADFDGSLRVVGLSDVPGGCVVIQPWGHVPADPEVAGPLSAGTVCYGVAANPKSGDQGIVARDGTVEDADTNPGGSDAGGHLTSEEILAEYLYQGHAVAYCCAAAGLRPSDARAVVGPPDMWVRLP